MSRPLRARLIKTACGGAPSVQIGPGLRIADIQAAQNGSAPQRYCLAHLMAPKARE